MAAFNRSKRLQANGELISTTSQHAIDTSLPLAEDVVGKAFFE